MISHARVASRIQRERARVRSEPVETTLTFYSLAPKKLCYYGGDAVSISVVSSRARDCVKTPLMVREPHHERVVQLARSSTLTDRPEPSRRAPVELSHSLAQREILDPSRSLGMTTSCLACRHTVSKEGVGRGAGYYWYRKDFRPRL
jgi:hypothetical protein